MLRWCGNAVPALTAVVKGCVGVGQGAIPALTAVVKGCVGVGQGAVPALTAVVASSGRAVPAQCPVRQRDAALADLAVDVQLR